MNLLQGDWAAPMDLAAVALLAAFVLLVVRVVSAQRLRGHEAACASQKAKLLAHIAAKADDPVAERELDGPAFATAAIELLMQIDGAPRKQLIDLMCRRDIDDRLRHDLRHMNKTTRVAAADALRFFPSHETRNGLLRGLRDRDLNVRLAAAASLVNLGAAPPLGELLPTLIGKGGRIPTRLGQILSDCCERNPTAVIAAARQKSMHPLIRARAVESLAATGETHHIAAIQSLVLAPEADLRAAVLRAFAKCPDLKSDDAIALCLRDDSWFVRAAAADTAGALGLYNLVPTIVPLVDDEQWWVRFRASEALEKLDAAGRSALLQMAKHGSERQKRQATLTLSKRLVA